MIDLCQLLNNMTEAEVVLKLNLPPDEPAFREVFQNQRHNRIVDLFNSSQVISEMLTRAGFDSSRRAVVQMFD